MPDEKHCFAELLRASDIDKLESSARQRFGEEGVDALHDAILTLYSREDCNPSRMTYLIRQTARKKRSRARKKTARFSPLGEMAGDVPDERCPSPVKQVIQRELRKRLDAALEAMPSHYARILKDKYFRDLSQIEIANEYGETCGAVNSLLNRAREWFKAHFGDQDWRS